MELKCICGNINLTKLKDYEKFDDIDSYISVMECKECRRILHIICYEKPTYKKD